MIYLLCVPLFFFSVLLVFHLCTKQYLNPYKLQFIVAKKGGGKTTTLTKIAINHLRAGWSVYTTFPVPGCYFIDYKDIGPYEFDERSCIIIDEVGMIWDARDFKNFENSVRDWFKLQRHRHCKCYMASQDFDVDIKLRKLCDSMYLLENKARILSYGRRIDRTIGIVEATGNSESRLVDQLSYSPFWLFWCGSRMCTFIPHWVPYFDSFEAPPLKHKEFRRLPPLQLDENERFSVRFRHRIDGSAACLRAVISAKISGVVDRIKKRSDDEGQEGL